MADEKKILALVGSHAGSRSNTRELCLKLTDTMKKRGAGRQIPMQAEIMTALEWNIGFCRSCGDCFNRGFCPVDEMDGMGALKKKILESDAVILASPVYAAAVSGDMKMLVDRLSGWLHTMPLIGKPVAVLSTAGSNHGDSAITYMKKMAELMGASVVVCRNIFIHYGSVTLKQEERLGPLLEQDADAMIRGLLGELPVTGEQEEYYKIQNRTFRKKQRFGRLFPAMRFAEERIWEEQGYFQYESMQEIIEERKQAYDGMV